MSEIAIKKLTDEESKSVKELRDKIATIISTVGQLKLTHDLLQADLATISDQLQQNATAYRELLGQERQITAGFLEKYGVGSLDIETGIFTPENK